MIEYCPVFIVRLRARSGKAERECVGEGSRTRASEEGFSMRIGIDARLVAYQRGGISTYIRRLVEALSEIDQQDEFTIFQSRRDDRPLVRRPGFHSSTLWTPPHHPWEQWALPLELAPRSLDLLHCPDFIPPFRRRCPAVITVHDLAFRRFPETKTPDSLRYYDQIDRAVAEAEAVIAVSQATKKDLAELLAVAPQRVEVVYHGVDRRYRELDDPPSVRAFCQSRGLPETFILWVGTQEPRKNLPCLFQALAAIKGRLPEAKDTLVVAGPKGWLYEEAESVLEDLGLRERTVFFGQATEEELLMLYNAAWALAFPSLYEGFGLPPLEAMACGTPVIASSAPALPEVLGDAALYFDPHQPEALAQHLLRLAEDTALWDCLRRAGLARAQGFRWRDTAEQTLAIYRSVAAP